jgi:PST family polysaccharide transporter
LEKMVDKEEAKRRHKKAPLMLLLRRFFVVGVGLVSTVTIARLVGPKAYGLASMAGMVLLLAQMFRDFGVTSALLRKRIVSAEERSFLFWFNTATTTVLALGLAIAAPFIADFYKEPVVAMTVLVSALGFWCGGVSLQHRSILLRDMRFAEIAWIDTVAVAVNFAVSLAIALVRHDVWAIVFGNLAQQVTGGSLYVLKSRFVPGRPRLIEGFGEILKFGANMSVFTISTFLSDNLGAILIGQSMGAAPLGQYNRAQNLFSLPNQNLVQPIAQATMPLLTHLRADPAAYREAYLNLVRTLSTLLVPSAVLLAFAGRPLTIVLLGPRWDEAGVMLSILAPALALMGLLYSLNDLFMTQDRSDELRTIGLAEMVFRIASVCIGVMFGLVGIALAYSISSAIVCVIRVNIAGRKGPVTAKDQMMQLLPALPIGLVCTMSCLLTKIWLWQSARPAVIELACLIGAAFLGGLMAMIFNPSRRAIIELFQTFGMPAGILEKISGRSKSVSSQVKKI